MFAITLAIQELVFVGALSLQEGLRLSSGTRGLITRCLSVKFQRGLVWENAAEKVNVFDGLPDL